MEQNGTPGMTTDQLLKRKSFLIMMVIIVITVLLISVGCLIYVAKSERWNVLYFVIPSLAAFIASIPLQYSLVMVLRELRNRGVSR